VVSDVVRHRF